MKPYRFEGHSVESTHRYVVGGLHPVDIGDIIHNRYRVVNKLGFGVNSTVWLVKDLSSSCFVSLKILSANRSSVSSELSVSIHLQQQYEQKIAHPGREHVIHILDTFTIKGPNGTHHCIVTEVLGIHLNEMVRRFYGPGISPLDFERYMRVGHFPEDVTKRIVGQVARGVAYLHHCGVIHGDLHLQNVLFYSSKIQTASLEEIDRLFGPPRVIPILYEDRTVVPPSPHLPRNLTCARVNISLMKLCISSVEDIHVKICDFSESSLMGSRKDVRRPFEPRMPRIVAAPEVLFNDISYPTTEMDIWALGALLFMIINQKEPPFLAYNGLTNEVIETIVLFLGKPPDKWWEGWSVRKIKPYNNIEYHNI